MDYHNLLKPLEILYFALKIISWSEQAYESNFDQIGYSALLEQAYIIVHVNFCS